MSSRRNSVLHRVVASAALGIAVSPLWAATGSLLPDLVPTRSSSRSQAAATLAAGTTTTCLTPQVQSIRSDRRHGSAAERRAIAILAADGLDRVGGDVDGFGSKPGASRPAAVVDRVQVLDDFAPAARADALDDAFAGLAAAQRLLVGQLELPPPGPLDLVLSRLGSAADSVSVPVAGRNLRTRILLDPAGRSSNSIRRAAEHQYAHAVAVAAGLDPSWGEAFASWATLSIEGSADDRLIALIESKLASEGDGLVTQDTDAAAGNAAWFEFLNAAYGPTAVKLAVEELGRGGSDQAALDRAMRRATGDSIDAALREFHVWSLLTGPRDDGRHFGFAPRLSGPVFAATEDALPALSVQNEPPVGPMGQAAIMIRPDERAGGVTIRFEGDVASRWGADLLLVHDDGQMRRVAMALDAESAGEATVPVHDVKEAILLVRNLDPEGRPARRYSWAAQFEPGFPTEFGPVGVQPGDSGGALVSWETAGERRLLGFNVLRTRADRTEATRLNPVWIPAVGEDGGPAAYSFVDATARPGVVYRYRIEAVTREGLAVLSEPVLSSSTQ